MSPKGVLLLETLTREWWGKDDDPPGSRSQNVRGELGWGVTGLFILYFLGREGEEGKCFRIRVWDLFFGRTVFDPRTG